MSYLHCRAQNHNRNVIQNWCPVLSEIIPRDSSKKCNQCIVHWNIIFIADGLMKIIAHTFSLPLFLSFAAISKISLKESVHCNDYSDYWCSSQTYRQRRCAQIARIPLIPASRARIGSDAVCNESIVYRNFCSGSVAASPAKISEI